MKNLAQLYSLAICFVSTIIILIVSICMFLDIINISFFDIRHNSQLNQYSSNELFKSSSYGNDREDIKNLSENQVTELRIAKKNHFIQAEKNRIWNSMINTIVALIVSLVFLLFHFKIYRKSSSSQA